MSKILFLAAFAMVATASVKAQKSSRETIKGNGNLVTRDVPVSPFDALKASGVYELKLSQGDKEAVKIEADENLQQYFNVHNEGNTLVIDMKGLKNLNMKNKSKLRVYVSFKKLQSLDLSTVGSVNAEKELSFSDLQIKNASVGKVDLALSANTLKFDNTSVGEVKLAGKAQNAVFTNHGVGNLDAGSFVVQTMNIENNGVGGATVNAEKELKVKDNMMSRVKNKGAAPMRKNNKVVI
ncbi:MAG TPA: head GIN domain-containing protein [Flavisolibacter sp.]|nr:head GIN domain-containing protein [Flavisolibacter sp.]